MRTHIVAVAVAVATAMAVGGCTPTADWRWPAVPVVPRALTARFPRAPAIALLRAEHLAMLRARHDEGYTEYERHEQLLITSEAGFRHAEVRIPLAERTDLRLLRARTISPEGEVQEVDPSEILKDEARLSPDGPGFDLVVRYRVFRFPSVRVGSIVEYVYRTRDEFIYGSRWEPIAPDIPVAEYRLALDFHDVMLLGVKVGNLPHAAPLVQEKSDGSGWQRLRLQVRDLPGDSDEEFQPIAPLRDPWWTFSTIRLLKAQPDPWLWVTEGYRYGLYSSRWYAEGFSPDFSVEDCDDAQCKVERALGWVRSHTRFTGFGRRALATRPLEKVVASGTASASERTLLLYELLRKAGVDAAVALTARGRGEGGLPRPFPSVAVFDHAIVRVLPGASGGGAMWVDPSCDFCKLGEVPPWLHGAEACVLERGRGDDREHDSVTFLPVDGPAAPASQVRVTWDAELRPGGDLVVTATRELRGSAGQSVRVATADWDDTRFRESAERFVRERHPSGRLESHSGLSCDPLAARCRLGYTFVLPGYASVDGERLVVPLTLLGAGWDDRFDDERREEDIYFSEPQTTVEVVNLKLPPGFAPATLPAPTRASAPVLDYSFAVSSTAGGLSMTRWLEARAGRYDKAAYPAVRRAVRAFAALRQGVIVLERHGAAR